MLFLVDRITLAGQTEDAFTDHLRDYPCYILRSGRGIDHAKRVTIATLQTMIFPFDDIEAAMCASVERSGGLSHVALVNTN